MERATIDSRDHTTAPTPDRIAEITRLLGAGARCSRCVQRATDVIGTTRYCRDCAVVERLRVERRQYDHARTVRPDRPRPRIGHASIDPADADSDVAAARARMRNAEARLTQTLLQLDEIGRTIRHPPRLASSWVPSADFLRRERKAFRTEPRNRGR